MPFLLPPSQPHPTPLLLSSSFFFLFPQSRPLLQRPRPPSPFSYAMDAFSLHLTFHHDLLPLPPSRTPLQPPFPTLVCVFGFYGLLVSPPTGFFFFIIPSHIVLVSLMFCCYGESKKIVFLTMCRSKGSCTKTHSPC